MGWQVSLLLLLVVAAATAWLLAKGGQRREVPIEDLERLYRPSVQPEPPPAPKPEPKVDAKPSTVALRLVSEAGRLIKVVEISPRSRRPAYRYQVNSGQVWVFNAERELSPGVWLYRRVGKERT